MQHLGWQRMVLVLGGFALAAFLYWLEKDVAAMGSLTASFAIIAPAALRAPRPKD